MIRRLHLWCIIFKLCHKLDRNSMNELMLFILKTVLQSWNEQKVGAGAVRFPRKPSAWGHMPTQHICCYCSVAQPGRWCLIKGPDTECPDGRRPPFSRLKSAVLTFIGCQSWDAEYCPVRSGDQTWPPAEFSRANSKLLFLKCKLGCFCSCSVLFWCCKALLCGLRSYPDWDKEIYTANLFYDTEDLGSIFWVYSLKQSL